MIEEGYSHQEVNLLIDSTIEGIILIKDGFIVDANKAFIKILEYNDKKEIIGNLASGCVMPSQNHKFIEFNNLTFEEISLVTKNGKIVPSIIKITDIVLNNENLKMASILDLSEFKKKEQHLIRQSRLAAMGEILSMIAHQWRQPLNAIAATLATIKIKILKNGDLLNINQKIENINTNLQFMSNTIDEFTDFYKDTQKNEFVNLNELILQATMFFESSIKNANIKIEFEKKELDKILINKNQILQVLINIINNSREAILVNEIKDGYIKISLDIDDKHQIITISDNGGGIPEEIRNKIFEPYFTTKSSINGTGFGLYMSKLILEKNNFGKILFENLDRGSCFKIMLKM